MKELNKIKYLQSKRGKDQTFTFYGQLDYIQVIYITLKFIMTSQSISMSEMNVPDLVHRQTRQKEQVYTEFKTDVRVKVSQTMV